MLCGAKVAVCSEINTKHINTVCQSVQILNIKPVGARNQQSLKVPATHVQPVPQRLEIPEGLTNYPVYRAPVRTQTQEGSTSDETHS